MKGCEAVKMSEILVSEYQKKKRRIVQWYRLYTLRQMCHSGIDPQYSTEVATGLSILLQHTKAFQATDPRDKIYGCLGLLTMGERETLRPDYQKPAGLLYLEVTKHLLGYSSNSFFSIFSVSRSEKLVSRALPSWVPDFSARETLSQTNPEMMLLRTGYTHGLRCVSFRDHNKILAITGIFLDTIEVAIELKGNQDLLFAQIRELERLAQHAVEEKVPLDDPHYRFQKLKTHEDVLQMITGGPRNNKPSFREQYDILIGRAELPSMVQDKDSRLDTLIYTITHILLGRYFLVTNRGFCGVAVARVRKNDSVVWLFGERIPMILRPRGPSHSMVGAAYVSGIMNGELIDDLYQNGRVKQSTFLIRLVSLRMTRSSGKAAM
jgi:hypothetical protein